MQNKASLPARARQTLQRGFTLIEIMVVIAILGIMAAVVVPKLVGHTETAKISAAKQDIANIKQALILYKLDNGRYPTTEQGLQALVTKPTSGPPAKGWKADGYLEKLPKDPWSNAYLYLNPGVHGEYDVFSYGASGQPGEGNIGSWEL